MSEFHLRKLKKEVTLQVEGVPEMKGVVFLNQSSSRHEGAERIGELLQAREAYLPFQKSGGSFLLIPKGAIQKMTVDADFELEITRAYGKSAYKTAEVNVILKDGKEEKGKLIIEPREASSRASDELNRERNFIKILTKKALLLIGTRHIAYVEEL